MYSSLSRVRTTLEMFELFQEYIFNICLISSRLRTNFELLESSSIIRWVRLARSFNILNCRMISYPSAISTLGCWWRLLEWYNRNASKCRSKPSTSSGNCRRWRHFVLQISMRLTPFRPSFCVNEPPQHGKPPQLLLLTVVEILKPLKTLIMAAIATDDIVIGLAIYFTCFYWFIWHH